MMDDNMRALDDSFRQGFERLYDELCAAFPHPFEWIGLMERPPWWRFRMRQAHEVVRRIFMSHGFILTDAHARDFRRQPGQGYFGPEDAGGAIVRQLRQTFQYQSGVPYHMTSVSRR